MTITQESVTSKHNVMNLSES